jgi:hypothetical protein
MSDISVGCEVAAVRNHRKGYFKIGDTFVVKGVDTLCACPKKWVDVGVAQTKSSIKCKKCGQKIKNDTGAMWFSESYFKPLDTDFDITELTEILEEELFEVIRR